MKKRLLSILLAALMMLSLLPATALADGADPGTPGTPGGGYDVSVFLHRNDGTNTMPSVLEDFAVGGCYTLPSQPFTREGWTIRGWATSADSRDVIYEDGATITGLTANLSLYAVWESLSVVNITVSVEGQGGVNGAGTYGVGQTVTLTASDVAGYLFVNWTENGQVVSNRRTLSFTAGADRHLVAHFEVVKHIITAVASPAEGGTATGAGTYDFAALITLRAWPNAGYDFVNWTEDGEVVSTDPIYSFDSVGDFDLVANFVLNGDPIDPDPDEPEDGLCGPNVYWQIVDGVLTLSGTGDTWDFIGDGGIDDGDTPWLYSSFTELVVRDGVTSIGAKAFEDRSSLTTVDLGSLERIGGSAFYGCTGLTAITLPLSVRTIDSCAFRCCSNLVTIYYEGTSAQWEAIEKASDWNRDCPADQQVICLGDPLVEVAVSPAEGGTVTGAGTYAVGGPVTLTVTPEEGYVLESLIVDGADVTADVANNAFTFDMPDHSVAVTAVFAEETTWDAIQEVFTNGGTITLRNNVTAPAGAPAMTVARSKSVTLDLNNYTLDRGLSGGSMQANGYVIFVSGSATLRITDGTVTGGANNGSGGGIYVDAKGVLELSGVAVRGNRSTDHGAGIYLYGSAQCTAVNSSVSDNQTTVNTNGGGGGIYLTSGSLNMTNCRINGNKAKNLGGGLYIESGHAELSDCEINGNDAYANACGGGVFLSGGGLRLDGCEVIGNTSSKSSPHGIGVFVNVGARFMVSGETTITDNKSGEQQLNVFLHNGAVIHPVNLADTASIGVAVGKTNSSYIAEYRAGVITSGLTDNGSAASFTSDLDDYEVFLNENGEAALALPADPVRVLVTDADSGEALEGVIVQLLWNCEEIETWTSGGEYQLIEGLKAGVEYTLHVAAAPEDHLAGEDSFFSVSADGRVTYSGNTTTNPIMETILLVELKAVSGHALSGEYVLFYPEGGYDPITEAHEGQTVVVSPDYDSIDAGWYFTGVYESDEVTVEVDEFGDGSFTMPTQAVTVNAVLAGQELLTVELLDDDAVSLPEEDLAGYLSGSTAYYFDNDLQAGVLDLNGDEAADVLLDFDNNAVRRLPGYAALTGSVTVPLNSPVPQRYWGVSFVFAAGQPAIVITQQPADASAPLGEIVRTTVAAEGEGLRYQWYGRDANGREFKSGLKGDTYSVALVKSKIGRVVWCVITDANGNSVTTREATLNVEYPSDYVVPSVTLSGDSFVDVGGTAVVTAAAEGYGELTYQWYFLNDGAEKWSKGGIKGVGADTYSVLMNSTRDQRQLYCVVTDAWGNSAPSNVVTIGFDYPDGYNGPTVTVSADDVHTAVDAGEYASVTVTAVGPNGENDEGLRYQWYLSSNEGATWSKSSLTGDTYSVQMVPSKSGRQVKCVVTDAYGKKTESAVFTLTMEIPPEYQKGPQITNQPESVTVARGEVASTTVIAEGAGLTYQWYGKEANGREFKSGLKGATYSVAMVPSKSGRQVWCVITDKYGHSVTSDPATLTMEP